MAEVKSRYRDGARLVVKGITDNPRSKTEKGADGRDVTSWTCNLSYMGGRHWARLQEQDAKKIKAGDIVVVDCEFITMKSGGFGGAGVIVEINGQPVNGG